MLRSSVQIKQRKRPFLLSRFDPARKLAREQLHPCTRARASAGTCRRPPSMSTSRRAWRSGSSKRSESRSGTRRSSATCGYSSTRRKRGRRAGWPTGQGCTPTSQHAALPRPQYDWSPAHRPSATPSQVQSATPSGAIRDVIRCNRRRHLRCNRRRHLRCNRHAITPSRRHSESGTLAIQIWKPVLIWVRNPCNPPLTCLKRKPISCR